MRILFSLPRLQKRILSVIIDVAFIILAFFGAIAMRLDNLSVLVDSHYWLFMVIVCPISIYIFARQGLYRAVLRHIGLQALTAIVVGVAVSTMTVALTAYISGLSLPRTVPIIYAAFATRAFPGATATS